MTSELSSISNCQNMSDPNSANRPSDELGAPEPSAPSGARLDCVCGNLLARRVPGGVELKCRRCKRVTVVRLENDAGA